jgi:hypothetical protein
MLNFVTLVGTFFSAIAKAVDAVSVALLNRALRSHPELESEIESRIATTGRYT